MKFVVCKCLVLFLIAKGVVGFRIGESVYRLIKDFNHGKSLFFDETTFFTKFPLPLSRLSLSIAQNMFFGRIYTYKKFGLKSTILFKILWNTTRLTRNMYYF